MRRGALLLIEMRGQQAIMFLKNWTIGITLIFSALPVGAQSVDSGLQGSWKYLRNFTYVHVDERDRIFQCRILPDLNVLTATASIKEDGAVAWEPVRFFSLYGQELSPSYQDWGRNRIELRNRIMFLNVLAASGEALESMEFDHVPQLPTLCAYYLDRVLE